MPSVSHVRSSFAALLIGALMLVASCGSDDAKVAPAADRTASDAGGVGVTETELGTTPKTCADLRIERYDYDELYREWRCQRQRRRLCRGIDSTSIRYADYRCALLHTKTSRKTAAKKRAAAKRKAAKAKAERTKAAAKRKAVARKIERNGFGGDRSTSSRGSAKSGGSASSGSSSSGGSSSSSSSSSGRSSSGGSSSSGGGRRR